MAKLDFSELTIQLISNSEHNKYSKRKSDVFL